MPELLLELGCEELPATFVKRATADLHQALADLLEKAGVLRGEGRSFGTPRRLIVSFPDLIERQPDVTKEQRGPALKAAYDEAGNPTTALVGFCRSQGIEPSALRKDEQYVWFTKTVEGRPTRELLAEILPQAIKSLTFDKTMRWGSARMRFARPIRWVLAAFGEEPVPFSIETVQSGLESKGHRFYAPETFAARKLDDLLSGLRKRFVEPDPLVRRTLILNGIEKVATGSAQVAEALLEENIYLTEWPTALQGEFREEFAGLPEPVLVTAMAKHEKMFPIRDADGKLTRNFVFIRNSGEDDTVRRGNEWVLNARFNDAKFFFDEDAKLTMYAFLERTNGIVFQHDLGTVRQRADRLAALAAEIASSTGAAGEEVELARQAGLYCKADLASGLVSELASLQGVVGGEYARRENMPEAVCWAIASHYDAGKNPNPDDARSRTAVRLMMADALDKLAGYLGLGLEPSGSSDPYGLRRAATVLIEAAWAWPYSMPSFYELFSVALLQYDRQGIAIDAAKAFPSLVEIFASRYAALMPEVRHDILEAALLKEIPARVTSPQQVRFRVRCLEQLVSDAAFVQTATRPMNIVIAARKKGIEYGEDDPLHRLPHSALQSAEGLMLFQVLSETAAPLYEAAEKQDVATTVSLLKGLASPINTFFDATMIMVDEPEVRYARLTLLHACSLALLTAGDFTKIVIEG